jgi:uncharacterized protein (DUF302 family)
MRHALILFALLLATGAGAEIAARSGWVVIPTAKDHATLLADLRAAVNANGLAVVTEAGPTAAASARGITIPENRVVGVFNNDFAVQILATSTAAMIEAPVRFYVTGNPDGTATLAWKTPGHVFAPYLDDGGDRLRALSEDLDTIFESIATEATR